jgi:hypothetical protein
MPFAIRRRVMPHRSAFGSTINSASLNCPQVVERNHPDRLVEPMHPYLGRPCTAPHGAGNSLAISSPLLTGPVLV